MNSVALLLASLVLSQACWGSPLFGEDSLLEVTLEGPLDSVFEHTSDEEAFPFKLKNGDDETQIMVSVRGNSRKRVCNFPPLKLDFGGSVGEVPPFSNQKSLKLVTHCSKSKQAQDNLLEEYAAYRIMMLLSEAAYRVRLLRINYQDTDDQQSIIKPGFIIESNRELAARLAGRRAKLQAVSLNRLDQRQAAQVYIFQYLIGNTDWSLVSPEGSDTCCHNGRLIERSGNLLYIPYDFDLSGLVNARYAKPDPSVGIRRVTQRRYRGFCLARPVLAAALWHTNSQQNAVTGMIENLPMLSAKAKKKNLRYLEKFFEQAKYEEKMLAYFEDRCLD